MNLTWLSHLACSSGVRFALLCAAAGSPRSAARYQAAVTAASAVLTGS